VEVLQNNYGRGHDRWPSRKRGYITKEGETVLTEQHHGQNIEYSTIRIFDDVPTAETKGQTPRLFGSSDQKGTNRNDIGRTWVDVPMARKRSVWTVPATSEKEAHFACFPETLIAPCIKAGCREGGVVLDPFMGSGTTAVAARKLNRNYLGFELNSEYCKLAARKLNRELGMFS
jgi:DNA modification methylase